MGKTDDGDTNLTPTLDLNLITNFRQSLLNYVAKVNNESKEENPGSSTSSVASKNAKEILKLLRPFARKLRKLTSITCEENKKPNRSKNLSKQTHRIIFLIIFILESNTFSKESIKKIFSFLASISSSYIRLTATYIFNPKFKFSKKIKRKKLIKTFEILKLVFNDHKELILDLILCSGTKSSKYLFLTKHIFSMITDMKDSFCSAPVSFIKFFGLLKAFKASIDDIEPQIIQLINDMKYYPNNLPDKLRSILKLKLSDDDFDDLEFEELFDLISLKSVVKISKKKLGFIKKDKKLPIKQNKQKKDKNDTDELVATNFVNNLNEEPEPNSPVKNSSINSDILESRDSGCEDTKESAVINTDDLTENYEIAYYVNVSSTSECKTTHKLNSTDESNSAYESSASTSKVNSSNINITNQDPAASDNQLERLKVTSSDDDEFHSTVSSPDTSFSSPISQNNQQAENCSYLKLNQEQEYISKSDENSDSASSSDPSSDEEGYLIDDDNLEITDEMKEMMENLEQEGESDEDFNDEKTEVQLVSLTDDEEDEIDNENEEISTIINENVKNIKESNLENATQEMLENHNSQPQVLTQTEKITFEPNNSSECSEDDNENHCLMNANNNNLNASMSLILEKIEPSQQSASNITTNEPIYENLSFRYGDVDYWKSLQNELNSPKKHYLAQLEDISPLVVLDDISHILSPFKNTDLSTLKNTDLSALKNTDSSPLKNTDLSPLKYTDLSPLKNTDLSFHKNTDSDSSPHKNTDSSPYKNTDLSPHKNTDSSPLKNTDLSPLKNTDLSPLKNTDSSPHKNTDSSALKNTDSSPLKNTDLSAHKNTDSSPHKNTDSSPLKNTDSSPHKNTDLSAHKNTDSSPLKNPNMLPSPALSNVSETPSSLFSQEEETGSQTMGPLSNTDDKNENGTTTKKYSLRKRNEKGQVINPNSSSSSSSQSQSSQILTQSPIRVSTRGRKRTASQSSTMSNYSNFSERGENESQLTTMGTLLENVKENEKSVMMIESPRKSTRLSTVTRKD